MLEKLTEALKNWGLNDAGRRFLGIRNERPEKGDGAYLVPSREEPQKTTKPS